MTTNAPGPRVLVVDDEENMRFTLKSFLNDAGFDVAVASDGEGAEALLATQEFHVALVDRMLSNGQDGVDVIKRLKQLNPFCEAILITAYPTFESATETLRCGSFDYLVKPVRRECVCKAVQNAAWASSQKRDEKSGLFLLQSISQVIPVPFAVFNESGRLLIANAAFQSTYTREELNLFDESGKFIPEAEREAIRADFTKLMAGDATETQRETRRLTKGGEFRDVREHLFSCKAHPLMPAHVVAIYEDLCELKNLEKRLLHADRLTTLGKMSAGMMHEIKNSLQAVSGYAQLALVKEPVRCAAETELSKIVDAARGMDDLCELIKKMVRLDDIEFCDLEPREALERALAVLEQTNALRLVSVQRRYFRQRVTIRGNFLLLQQVFINCIMNAVHAMEECEKKTLNVSTDYDPEKKMASISIRDAGCGIPREVRERIFEPFYSTYQHKGGTGLGLSIVSQIVRQHSGSIKVASVVGRGTVFTVQLPATAAEECDAPEWTGMQEPAADPAREWLSGLEFSLE